MMLDKLGSFNDHVLLQPYFSKENEGNKMQWHTNPYNLKSQRRPSAPAGPLKTSTNHTQNTRMADRGKEI